MSQNNSNLGFNPLDINSVLNLPLSFFGQFQEGFGAMPFQLPSMESNPLLEGLNMMNGLFNKNSVGQANYTQKEKDILIKKTFNRTGLGAVRSMFSFPQREHRIMSDPSVKDESAVFGSQFNERAQPEDSDISDESTIIGESFDSSQDAQDIKDHRRGKATIF